MRSGRPRRGIAASRVALAGAALLAALAGAAVTATAAPPGGRLTINAVPNPNVVGDPMLIYGELKGAHPGGQKIRLFHRIHPASRFTLVRTTTTISDGFYEFNRAEGIVTTDRSWFVRGPEGARSRTVHVAVSALLTIAASAATASTNRPLRFSGSVSPARVHAHEAVALQMAAGEGGGWTTIGTGMIHADSTYAIAHRFLQPGVYELRATFAGDARNGAASSDLVTVVVQQAQRRSFTINSDAPLTTAGSSVVISGMLFAPGSSSVGRAATGVTLWAQPPGLPYEPVSSTTTGPDGSYDFTVSPVHDTVFQVRTTRASPAQRVTAQLFEGVGDVISLAAGVTSAAIGEVVTFSGAVVPDKAGHPVYLQRMGRDGHFHTVRTGIVSAASTFSTTFVFGAAGTVTLRARIPGGPSNVGAVSPPVALMISLPSLKSLPPAG